MFVWDIDKYSVGVEEIDNHHKRLFELGKELEELVEINDNVDRFDEIMSILNELKEYTEYHFNYEENLLKEHDYDSYELKLHTLQHKSFINKFYRFDEEEIDYEQREKMIEMLTFIENWIKQHILKIDFKYKDLFKKIDV